jgi:transcriptional regulator with XRE-family HTH domain
MFDSRGSVENPFSAVNFLFGAKLSSARRARKVSQAELGERVGLSRITIAKLERGVQNVQLCQVFLIARALDMPPEDLIPSSREFDNCGVSQDALYLELIRSQMASAIPEVDHEESSQ